MDYAILIWKNPDRMADIKPAEKGGKLEQITNAVKEAAFNNPNRYKDYNPDILMDKDGVGDYVIKTVKITFEHKDFTVAQNISRTVRVARIAIKGNLYLPIKAGLKDKATSVIGSAQEENDKKNTLRLMEWAQVMPDAKKDDGYYRAIVILVMTKAGDFRVISANNVYVDYYKENYQEGEFGTFELILSQRADATTAVKVNGLDEEKKSVADQIKGALGKTAKTVGKVAAVAGTVAVAAKVASSIGTKVVETVETFTGGESETSKKWKKGFGIASNTSDMLKSTSNIANLAVNEKDKNKKAKAISKEIEDISAKANKSVQDDFNIDTEIKDLAVTKSKVESLEKTYYDKLSNDEKEAYARLDSNGKLKMLLSKKKTAETKIETEKNQAIIDEITKQNQNIINNITSQRVEDLEPSYRSMLTAEELKDYDKADNKGKLNMLLQKKTASNKKTSANTNTALSDALDRAAGEKNGGGTK